MAKDFAKAFYNSKAWKNKRKSYMREKHFLCERCGQVGEIVHHKIRLSALNINDSNVTLNSKNLELVCWTCHNKIDHDHLDKDNVKLFDDDGNYLPPLEI